MFVICLSPLSNLNIFVVRLDLVGLDWVGLNSPNIGGSRRHVYRGLFRADLNTRNISFSSTEKKNG